MVRKKIRYLIITLLVTAIAIGVFGLSYASKPEPEAEPSPSELNIAIVVISVLEEPWNTVLLQALERVKEKKPHGLTIDWDISESVQPPDAERVFREYAKTGKYEILWSHGGAFGDAVVSLHSQYPEILWVGAGAGYEFLGGNVYLVDSYVHEPVYMMGMIAGMMTETNTIGVVASYPVPSVNAFLNAYRAGARRVNPDVKVIMTYIDSWYDPPKAKESALAQIAAGADLIYAERFGPFEALKEKDVYGFGHFADQYSMAPEVVLTSPVSLFDPVVEQIIDEWWNHKTNGEPYAAPMETIIYGMKDGGSTLAPYYDLQDVIPEKVKQEVEKAKQEIMEGKLVIPFNPEKPVSD